MKAALFDLDGVLIDTEGIYSKYWAAMGERYNVGIEDFSNVIKGTTLTQILDKYFPKDKYDEIIQDLKDFEENMQYEIFDGVMDFLSVLKEKCIPSAIVTSSNNEKISRLWSQHPGFKGYFSAIITDADVQRSKPDPQGYLLAAEALGVDPAFCVVFEDSYNGLMAGRRAGGKVVALSTTNPAETLSDKADLVIESFTNKECLLRFLGL